VSQRESLYVDEEQRLVAEVEPLPAAAQPGVRVAEASFIVVEASAAPCSEVGAVDAGGLDEAHGGQGLRLPESESLPPELCLYDAESFGSDPPLHLAEVGFGGGLISVSADLPEIWVSPETLHQVLDVGYLE
jgi:hypothetical protein